MVEEVALHPSERVAGDIEKLFYTTILDLLAQLGTAGRTLRNSIIYSSILIALILFGFSLVHQASSQSET